MGLIFKLRHWAIPPAPFAGIWVPLWVHLGVLKWPQKGKNSIKTCFLVVLDNFCNKNGPNDLVKGLFSSLDIGPYVLPTCRPLGILSGPFGGAKMAPK
jgi:hypothetical protein